VMEAATRTLRANFRVSPAPLPPPMPETVAPGAALLERYREASLFEGPTWDPKGENLYFTAWGGTKTKVLRLESTGQTTVWIEDAKGLKGTYLSHEGKLLGVQVHTHRVNAYGLGASGPSGEQMLAENTDWNEPNDLCQSSSGDVFFSDPDFGQRESSGVYRLAPDGQVTKVIEEIPVPNGLITSVDDKMLVVADSHLKWWRAYPIEEDGAIGPGRVFFISETTEQRDPDGMTIDEQGNFYLTGGAGVWVVKPNGDAMGMIPVPEFVSNVTFGGRDGNLLFLTCQNKVYSLQMQVRGAMWRDQR